MNFLQAFGVGPGKQKRIMEERVKKRKPQRLRYKQNSIAKSTKL